MDQETTNWVIENIKYLEHRLNLLSDAAEAKGENAIADQAIRCIHFLHGFLYEFKYAIKSSPSLENERC